MHPTRSRSSRRVFVLRATLEKKASSTGRMSWAVASMLACATAPVGEARLPLGEESLGYNLFYGGYGEIDRWRAWARWKLGFIDAAWKQARFGVSWVRPDHTCATQSQHWDGSLRLRSEHGRRVHRLEAEKQRRFVLLEARAPEVRPDGLVVLREPVLEGPAPAVVREQLVAVLVPLRPRGHEEDVPREQLQVAVLRSGRSTTTSTTRCGYVQPSSWCQPSRTVNS